jgi:hypothetical protein
MQRHELDSFSLFAGVVFVAITASYTLTHTTGVRLHWLIVVPAFLLLMGAAVTALAVRRIVAGDAPVPQPLATTVAETGDTTGDVTDPT